MFTKNTLFSDCQLRQHRSVLELISFIAPLPEKPSLLCLVSSHRPKQAPATVFSTTAKLGALLTAECIVVTSQPDGSTAAHFKKQFINTGSIHFSVDVTNP